MDGGGEGKSPQCSRAAGRDHTLRVWGGCLVTPSEYIITAKVGLHLQTGMVGWLVGWLVGEGEIPDPSSNKK